MSEKIERIPIDQLTIDPEIQPRVCTHGEVVKAYTEHVATGGSLAPVSVWDDGEKKWVSDGFHTVLAYKAADFDVVDCIVHKGTRQDAIWHGAGANKGRALQMSSEDKERAVRHALLVKPEESSRSIAEHVGVGHPFVERIRLLVESDSTPLTSRKGKDGKVHPARKKKPAPEPETAPEAPAPEPTAEAPAPEPAPQILCKTCQKTGKPRKDCKGCVRARTDAAKAAAAAAGLPAPEPATNRIKRGKGKNANGRPVMDFKGWHASYGVLVRQITAITEEYKAAGGKGCYQVRQALKGFKVEFIAWYERVTSEKFVEV